MANGRAIGRFEAALGLVGILALGITYSLITGWNPWPSVQGWLDRTHTLAAPAAAWTTHTGDPATSATLAGGALVVITGGSVESIDPSTGTQLWSAHAGYAAVAGQPTGQPVVIAGHPASRGYDAIDPRTGAVLWSAPSVLAVWTFQELVVGLVCPQEVSCTLTGRTPTDGHQVWQSTLPGTARWLAGANHALAGVHELASAYGATLGAVPAPLPPLLGFPLDNQVVVVSTSNGAVLHTYRNSPGARYVVAGPRVIATTVAYRSSACLFTIQGRDPATDASKWRMSGYNPRTGDALGCDQHRDPAGGAGMIAALGPDNRDVLLDVATGHVLFTAAPAETILASDGRVVLVRTDDRKTVRAASLGTGQLLWSRSAGTRASAGLVGNAAVIEDPGANRLVAVDARSGAVLIDERSQATVLAFGDSGLLVHLARDLAWLSYTAAAPSA
jgi:outer membrane protein assembly factor BamB